MKQKNILVAGAAGFLGSNLCLKLVETGEKVFGMDNLSTGNLGNLKNLRGRKNFQFLKQDITSKINGKFDEIYHLASPASPPEYQKNPLGTIRANTIGTQNLLETARNNRAKFLFASTSEIYGDPKEHPQKETYFGNVNTMGIRSCYDESKRLGETLCFEYRKLFKVDAKVARIFNTYGPGMKHNDGRAVANFITRALLHKPIQIYGSGTQTRSLIYVDDLITGLVKLMEAKNFSGPVNLGNTQEISILKLAEKIISLTKSKSPIVHLPPVKDDPLKRKPDIALAKRKFNFKPIIGMDRGLLATISYFKKGV